MDDSVFEKRWHLWIVELRRILAVRAAEARPKDSAPAEEQARRYLSTAKQVCGVDPVAFGKVIAQVAAIDKMRHEELRLKAAREGGQPPQAPTARTTPEHFARCVSLAREAAKVDQRKLLQISQAIARNDTWGNFDPKKVLDPGSPDFEQHAKVLINSIESFEKEVREERAWTEYEQTLSGLALRANRRDERRVEPRGPMSDMLDRSRKLEIQAPPERIYKLAILGAGSAAAYYIANASIDRDNTVLIGERQPWDEERGASGMINHPGPQIDPHTSGRIDAEEGLSSRRRFTAVLKAIIDQMPHQCDGRIREVSKERDPETALEYWKIETTKGVYFAQRVESALGAGPQNRRGLDGTEMTGEDMDSFRRSIDEVGAEERDKELAIGILGGNAAIDVVTDVLRKYSKAVIHWATGPAGPAFFRGSDNDIAAVSALDVARRRIAVIAGHLQGAGGEGPKTGQGDKATEGANAEALKRELEQQRRQVSTVLEPIVAQLKETTANWEQVEGELKARVRIHQAQGALQDNPGPDKDRFPHLLVVAGQRIPVHRAVFAIGQDARSVAALFTDRTGAKAGPLAVAPQIDVDDHFVVSVEETDPDAIRRAVGVPGLGIDNGQDLLRDPALDAQSLRALSSRNVPIGAVSSDGSLTMRGEQGAIAAAQGVPVGGRVAETHGPNVVVDRQLTTARSMIEAALNSMPSNAGGQPLVMEPDGVSFVTANQTVLAVHIASVYPLIPPGVANYIVAQIIVDRCGVNGPVPRRRPQQGDGDPEHDLRELAAFQDKWRSRLQIISNQLRPAVGPARL